MPIENGVNWVPLEPEKRGRHRTFTSALQAALGDMVLERSPFYDALCDNWRTMFPELPAWPGRLSGDTIWLYVRTAPTLFAMRPKLSMIRRRLAELPDAPAKIELRLEIHAQ